MSYLFNKEYKKIKKENRDLSFEDLKVKIADIARSALPPLPDAMLSEIVLYFIAPAYSEDELEKLSDFIDFMNEDLDAEKSVLSEEDWLFTRDLVNMFADDLDMDFITFVMRAILDLGLIEKR